jgi:tetratricopeptide (TPR) repeat protein
MSKVGRNDRCPCGSNNKYKHCCGRLGEGTPGTLDHQPLSNPALGKLNEAFEHLKSGRLAEAERVYRRILENDPDNADALHYQGVIAYNVGQNELAVALIGKAVRLAPTASSCSNLGLAFQALGELEAAAEQYRNAISQQPNHAVAHNNIGNALKDLGKFGEAITHYRQALALRPNFSEAHQNLDALLNRIEDLNVQLSIFGVTIDLAIDRPEKYARHNNKEGSPSSDFSDALLSTIIEKAGLFHQSGKPSHAEALCQLTRQIKPNHSGALYLLGVIANEMGRADLALELGGRAVKENPALAEIYQEAGLGKVERDDVSFADAMPSNAVYIRPDYPRLNGPVGELRKPMEATGSGTSPDTENNIIEIVSATRLSEHNFWKKSALGRSLRCLGYDSQFAVNVAFNNQRGLSGLYNDRIQCNNEDRILVFIHDDVWIDDFFFADRLIHSLTVFDVIGVAGNCRRVPMQAGWGFLDDKLTAVEGGNLRGSIAHGQQSYGVISSFGKSPAECELLDGVILAARKSRLVAAGVQFDPRFNFHFYDIDFCRTAREKCLRVGTWPLYLTHQSHGNFDSPGWREMYLRYLDKWKT